MNRPQGSTLLFYVFSSNNFYLFIKGKSINHMCWSFWQDDMCIIPIFLNLTQALV